MFPLQFFLCYQQILKIFFYIQCEGFGTLIHFSENHKSPRKKKLGINSTYIVKLLRFIFIYFFSFFYVYSMHVFCISSQEMYTNPRSALFVTLVRTFLMEGVVVGVVVAFWLTHKKSSEVGVNIMFVELVLILYLQRYFFSPFLRLWSSSSALLSFQIMIFVSDMQRKFLSIAEHKVFLQFYFNIQTTHIPDQGWGNLYSENVNKATATYQISVYVVL